jgi:adenylate cyclase
VQVTRVLGQSLARVADAEATLFEEVLTSDASSLPEAVEALRPVLESFLTYTWRRHLAAALHSRMLLTDTGGSEDGCVGFADLVGFTAVSQQRSYEELAAMVERFESLAYDVVAAHGGRVIKMIGDEVMFAVGPARAGGLIALEIAAACAGDPLIPSARVGVARGGALRQAGDLFGPTVNVASRLVNIAAPGTVLVSDELARSIGEAPELALRRLRPQHLRGIGEIPVYVLRWSTDQGASAPPSADASPVTRRPTRDGRPRRRGRSGP